MKTIQYWFVLAFGLWLAFTVSESVQEVVATQFAEVINVLEGETK